MLFNSNQPFKNHPRDNFIELPQKFWPDRFNHFLCLLNTTKDNLKIKFVATYFGSFNFDIYFHKKCLICKNKLCNILNFQYDNIMFTRYKCNEDQTSKHFIVLG